MGATTIDHIYIWIKRIAFLAVTVCVVLMLPTTTSNRRGPTSSVRINSKNLQKIRPFVPHNNIGSNASVNENNGLNPTPPTPPPTTPPPPSTPPPGPAPPPASLGVKMPPVLATGNRIAFYQHSGGYGFGNHARGLVYTILYALLTNRRPVLASNFAMYRTYFKFPADGTSPPNLGGPRQRLNQQQCEKDPQHANVCLGYTGQIVQMCEGVTMDIPFYSDPKIRSRIKAMFGSDRRSVVTATIVNWMYSQPTETFLAAAESYKSQNKLNGPYSVFQLRSWADVASKFKPELISPECVELVEMFNKWNDALPDSNPAKNNHVLYLTSDSKLGMQLLLKAVNPEKNSRVKLANMATDFQHTANVKGPHISSAMIDWYLMGTDDVSANFCSGTTFCISASFRRNFPPVPIRSHYSFLEKNKNRKDFELVEEKAMLNW